MCSVRSIGSEVNASAPFFQRIVTSQLSLMELASGVMVTVLPAGS